MPVETPKTPNTPGVLAKPAPNPRAKKFPQPAGSFGGFGARTTLERLTEGSTSLETPLPARLRDCHSSPIQCPRPDSR
jgi:hypothetical protein